MDSLQCNTFKSTKGRLKLCVNGYIYNKNRQVNNKCYWICELQQKEKRCNSRVITIENPEDETHKVLVNTYDDCHNHDPDPARLSVATIINSIKTDAFAHTGKKTCQIIQDGKRESNEQILSHLPSTSSLRQIVYREKKKGRPVFHEPSDIYFEVRHDELQLHKNNFVICDEFFDDNKRIIIFSCEKMMDYLGRSKLLIMDGTFYVASTKFLQLYVIHGNVFEGNRQTFHLVFALCTHKDKKTYNKLFDLIITYCNEHDIIIQVNNVIMDFELTAIMCVKQNFDNVSVNGCFFHLAQSIYRRIQRAGKTTLYGTNLNFSTEMKCLLALAFLDKDEIPIYFEKLQETISPDGAEIIQKFGTDYVIGDGKNKPRYPPELWSISILQRKGLPKTQNHAESWHHRINQIIAKKNPGFYCLANELLLESKVIMGNIECLINGQPPPKQKKVYLEAQKRINNILKNKSQYTECEFLRALATNLKLRN